MCVKERELDENSFVVAEIGKFLIISDFFFDKRPAVR